MTAKLNQKLSKQAIAFLELIYSDIYRPIAFQILGNKRYVATFINLATK